MRRISLAYAESTSATFAKQLISCLSAALILPTFLLAQGSPDSVDPGIAGRFRVAEQSSLLGIDGLGVSNEIYDKNGNRLWDYKPTKIGSVQRQLGISGNPEPNLQWQQQNNGVWNGLEVADELYDRNGNRLWGYKRTRIGSEQHQLGIDGDLLHYDVDPNMPRSRGVGVGRGSIADPANLSVAEAFAHGAFSLAGDKILKSQNFGSASFNFFEWKNNDKFFAVTFNLRYRELQNAAYKEDCDDSVIFLAGFVHYQLGHNAEAEREILRFLERIRFDGSASNHSLRGSVNKLLFQIRARRVPAPIPLEELENTKKKNTDRD